MPKQYRLRIRGRQREDIDLDLLAQALLMVAEDLQAGLHDPEDKHQPPGQDDQDQQQERAGQDDPEDQP